MKKAPTQAQIEARMIRDEKRELRAASARILRDLKAETKRIRGEINALTRSLTASSNSCAKQLAKIKRRLAILAGRSHI